MHKALLIVNPIAGTSRKEGVEDAVREALSPLTWQIDVAYTTGRGDATRLAHEAAGRYQAVIAVGGDGTINETASGLRDTAVTVGIIPCGSGNGLARHLGIPIDVDQALRVIAEGHVVRSDYATANDKPFFCTCGVGFDAVVSENFANLGHRGLLAYIRTMLTSFARFTPSEYVIKANGEVLTEKAFLVAVCNASQYGNNAYIAPDASITDGLLDVTIIHEGSLLETARAGIDILTGYIYRNTLINTFRTSNIAIERKDGGGLAHIDGEPFQLSGSLSIECHPKALSFFYPANRQPFKPVITPLRALAQDIKIYFNKLIKTGIQI